VNGLRWGLLLVFLVVALVIGIYIMTNSNINEQKALTIANSYVGNELPSFLLDQIYLIDTRKENISEIREFKGTVWYLKYIQDVETTAIFYIDSENGDLLKGYIINRNGEVIKKFN
jgi:hypothetical protein